MEEASAGPTVQIGMASTRYTAADATAREYEWWRRWMTVVRAYLRQINKSGSGELNAFELDIWFGQEMESIGESVRKNSANPGRSQPFAALVLFCLSVVQFC